MKMLMLACALAGLASAQAGEIQKVEGKALPSVPGPLAQSHYLRDLASPLGNTSLELRIRRSARGANAVPCIAVPPGDVAIAHQVTYPAGWQAYRVEVPPGERIKARLRGDHEAWYVVRCVNRWGQLAPGMLRNLLHQGDPVGFYHNVGKAPATVYFVVDTSEVTSDEPYTLTVTRELPSGQPAKP